MFLSESEAEARLSDLRRQRDALDRLIADHLLYLELGRRLPSALAAPTKSVTDIAAPRSAATEPVAPMSDVAVDDRGEVPQLDTVQAGSGDVVTARRHGRALIAAAVAILSEVRRPLHAGQILERLAARGFSLPGADPVAALNTRLWKRAGPGGPFRRMGDAMYALADADEDERSP